MNIDVKKIREFWNTGFAQEVNKASVVQDSNFGVKAEESAFSSIDQVAKPDWGPLSYSDLRRVYLKSSAVRPCVDAISQYISSLPWTVSVKRGSDPIEKERVKTFFMNPNFNKESIRTILAKVTTDILVIDAGVIEKVYSPSGRLVELYARDGATFSPSYDIHGGLLGYEQQIGGHKIPFLPKEIVHLQFYPRTWSFWGTPIIETIIDEVATLLFSSNTVSKSFDEDEIPPGILSMDKIGQEAFERLKVDLKGEKGVAKKQLKVIKNAGEVKWIDFKRSFREMELAELNSKIESVIWRNFGIKNAEMEPSSRFIISFVQMLNYYINHEIVADITGGAYFKLIPQILDEKEEKAKEAQTRGIKNLVSSNVLDVESAKKLIQDRFFIPEEGNEE